MSKHVPGILSIFLPAIFLPWILVSGQVLTQGKNIEGKKMMYSADKNMDGKRIRSHVKTRPRHSFYFFARHFFALDSCFWSSPHSRQKHRGQKNDVLRRQKHGWQKNKVACQNTSPAFFLFFCPPFFCLGFLFLVKSSLKAKTSRAKK